MISTPTAKRPLPKLVSDTRSEAAAAWMAVMGRGLLAFLFSLTITGVIGLDVTPALLFGVYALADGLLLLWIVRRTVALVRSRFVFRTAAILSIGAGIAGIFMNAVMTPFVPHIALFSLLGTWAFLTGITEITAGWPLRRENAGEVLILMVALGGLARLLLRRADHGVLHRLPRPSAGHRLRQLGGSAVDHSVRRRPRLRALHAGSGGRAAELAARVQQSLGEASAATLRHSPR